MSHRDPLAEAAGVRAGVEHNRPWLVTFTVALPLAVLLLAVVAYYLGAASAPHARPTAPAAVAPVDLARERCVAAGRDAVWIETPQRSACLDPRSLGAALARATQQ